MSNSIYVSANKPFYVGGDIVEGVCVLDIVSPLDGQAVLVKFMGYERAHWEEDVTRSAPDGEMRTVVEERSQRREFFEDEIMVATGGVLQPGHYEFPFSYQLPMDLPGVFSESRNLFWGHRSLEADIYYEVKAYVKRGFFSFDLKSFQPLVVMEKVNHLVAPAEGENSKSFMFGKGRLSVHFQLDKNTYFPGQALYLQMRLHNESSKNVTAVRAILRRTLEMRAHGHYKTHTEVIRDISFEGVEAYTEDNRSLLLEIPADIQPSASGDLVNAQYELHMECVIPMAIDLNVHLPVMIVVPQALVKSTASGSLVAPASAFPEQQLVEASAPSFDPMTGEPIGPPARFDPMTGQPIEPAPAYSPPAQNFDPMTGQRVAPVAPQAHNPAPVGLYQTPTPKPIYHETTPLVRPENDGGCCVIL